MKLLFSSSVSGFNSTESWTASGHASGCAGTAGCTRTLPAPPSHSSMLMRPNSRLFQDTGDASGPRTLREKAGVCLQTRHPDVRICIQAKLRTHLRAQAPFQLPDVPVGNQNSDMSGWKWRRRQRRTRRPTRLHAADDRWRRARNTKTPHGGEEPEENPLPQPPASVGRRCHQLWD